MNVLIAGVGGQGTLLASRVLGKYAMLAGKDCKLSEIHGMSQRGGSVVTHVRIGDKIYSPVIWEGSADVVLAFEALEAARVKHYLKKGGVLLVNDEKILPMPCITGAAKYPDGLKEKLLSENDNVHFVAAQAWALEAGSAKATNIVMLGALCKLYGFDKEIMTAAVSACVPEKFRALNMKAFELGYERV
ncbi:MAG: indolepyruvate oxidoreductase subunit beta [Clostridiales bacterium]|nr:indolepyruvate oxidoreductase subunit beta [Clostridiales bacterium]